MEFQFRFSKGQKGSYFPVDLCILGSIQAIVLEDLFEPSDRRREGWRVCEGSDEFLVSQDVGFQFLRFVAGKDPELTGDFFAQVALRLRITQRGNED